MTCSRRGLPAGVGGRGTGPRDGANFAVVSNVQKEEKWRFLKDAGRGYPPELAGGVDQGPWLQERVGVGAGLVGCSKEGQVQARVGLLGSSTGGGKGSRGNPRASVPEG